jgi:hypothetical protein
MWLRDLEPLYQQAARFDKEMTRTDTLCMSEYIQVLRGIRGLDHFLTGFQSALNPFVFYNGVVHGGGFLDLSDGVSVLHVDIAHDPVLWLGDCTPEVKARWKELEQEVLRMS